MFLVADAGDGCDCAGGDDHCRADDVETVSTADQFALWVQNGAVHEEYGNMEICA